MAQAMWLTGVGVFFITAGLGGAAFAGSPLRPAPTGARVQTTVNAQAAAAGQIGKVITDGRVTLLQLKNAQAVPSQVLRTFKSEGKVYVINQNGIIFGAPKQVDTHSLTTAAIKPTNDDGLQLEDKRRRQRKADSMITATVVGFGEAGSAQPKQ